MKLNLFELAENQLIKEKRERRIPCYTLSDIIEYSIQIRKWLDENNNKVNKIIKLSKEEISERNKEARRRYYLKTGR